MQPKTLIQSKTFWLAFTAFIISLLGFIQGHEFIQEYPQIPPIIGIVISALQILIRYFTSAPIKSIK